MNRLFAPGCALYLYKPELVAKLHTLLNENIEEMKILHLCCKNQPRLNIGTEVIIKLPFKNY